LKSTQVFFNNLISLDDERVSAVHMEYEDAATSPALDFLPLDFNDCPRTIEFTVEQ
jgi:hypothetical protein